MLGINKKDHHTDLESGHIDSQLSSLDKKTVFRCEKPPDDSSTPQLSNGQEVDVVPSGVMAEMIPRGPQGILSGSIADLLCGAEQVAATVEQKKPDQNLTHAEKESTNDSLMKKPRAPPSPCVGPAGDGQGLPPTAGNKKAVTKPRLAACIGFKAPQAAVGNGGNDGGNFDWRGTGAIPKRKPVRVPECPGPEKEKQALPRIDDSGVAENQAGPGGDARQTNRGTIALDEETSHNEDAVIRELIRNDGIRLPHDENHVGGSVAGDQQASKILKSTGVETSQAVIQDAQVGLESLSMEPIHQSGTQSTTVLQAFSKMEGGCQGDTPSTTSYEGPSQFQQPCSPGHVRSSDCHLEGTLSLMRSTSHIYIPPSVWEHLHEPLKKFFLEECDVRCEYVDIGSLFDGSITVENTFDSESSTPKTNTARALLQEDADTVVIPVEYSNTEQTPAMEKMIPRGPRGILGGSIADSLCGAKQVPATAEQKKQDQKLNHAREESTNDSIDSLMKKLRPPPSQWVLPCQRQEVGMSKDIGADENPACVGPAGDGQGPPPTAGNRKAVTKPRLAACIGFKAPQAAVGNGGNDGVNFDWRGTGARPKMKPECPGPEKEKQPLVRYEDSSVAQNQAGAGDARETNQGLIALDQETSHKDDAARRMFLDDKKLPESLSKQLPHDKVHIGGSRAGDHQACEVLQPTGVEASRAVVQGELQDLRNMVDELKLLQEQLRKISTVKPQGHHGVLLNKELVARNDCYKKVSHYTELDCLGSGAFGDVFLLQDTTSKKEFAGKYVNLDGFIPNEALLWCGLNHPNIVGLLGLVRTDSEVLFLSEYHPCQTLQELLNEGALGQGRALLLIEQVFEALAYLHEQGIIHYDIKLDNILVQLAENRIWIIDFGCAMKLSAEDETDIASGMAGAQPCSVGHATDVWSAITALMFSIGNQAAAKACIPPNTDIRLRQFIEEILGRLQRDPDRVPTAAEVLKKWPRDLAEELYSVPAVSQIPNTKALAASTDAREDVLSVLGTPSGPPNNVYHPPVLQSSDQQETSSDDDDDDLSQFFLF